jgi:c-di-GMP-binding flagellar brake protein YcgR
METGYLVERRMNRRFNVDLPIRYYKPDSATGRNGRAMNVSEGGILIHLPDRMEIGQIMKLTLSFLFSLDWESVEAMTEVIWWDFDSSEVWGDYRSGMKFVNMSSKENEKYKKLLKHLSC